MVLYSRYINLKVHETTLPLSASEGQMVEATSAPLEQGSLPVSVRHPSKESKAEETHKKGKMITIKIITAKHLLRENYRGRVGS